ncbi:hypothetical protein CLV24_107144 [Pontibacter ummariensis]|uniref:SpoIIAA-like n=1 Tax=Pontibacter ummariensis TaxID=1610492 RepID=A0A239EUE1_9BACT|nr:hypothetical protein [Pontibacter ummariensis]PRY12772.1 hypothetical protein CLV24_107144 [Pontibacter ummariensis]SNS47512.1 hypothetical protein SAMN06296052_10744 [Pontibacter ummariensis]
MILFENGLLKLDYNPATDILEVAYPDLHDYLLSEIKHSINILIDTIKHYDVKKVLLDSTRTVISVSDEESREIAVYLATGLMGTRVQKVARVQSSSTTVEITAQGNMRHIKESQLLSYDLQNFNSKAEAETWLKDKSTVEAV